jgi:aminobenzoyl-glutamate transport protein
MVALLLIAGLVLAGLVPENGLLRGPDGSILRTPLLKGFISFLFIFAAILGIIYGFITGKFKSDADVVKGMVDSFKTLAGFLVLVFFAAQFVYFFNYSNLGIIFAIKGAQTLQTVGLTGIPLIVAFVLLSAFINMFMGSASAKWAIMAPVFIPMLMLIDPPYHPGLTQAAFRIGDSVTNLITPMMSYFALIVTFAEKYDEKYGIGTIISTMLPYTIVLTIIWVALLVIWMLTGLPLGPDGPLYMPV